LNSGHPSTPGTRISASTTWGTPPPPACQAPGAPANLTAKAGRRSITLTWQAGSPAPAGGYRIYYVQAGKLQFRAGVSAGTASYKDGNLSRNVQYCYAVTAWEDCNGNGVFDPGIDTESQQSNQACATAQ